MNTSKIIKGVVGGGRYTVTAPIIKEDYGLYLQIEGIDLPETYEVDFSNDEHSGSSVTMIGNSDGVLIPSQFIKSGKDVFAFLYHVGEDYGRTVFKFRIPNKLRPDRTDEEPTPEEQSTIDQAINALNTAVEQTAQDVIDADASAQSAKDDAERAEQAKNGAETAQGKAEEAQESAERAKDDAESSERNASESERKAKGYAETASEKADSIHSMTASAHTLPAGSSASASYDANTGVMTFGIPKGDKGEKGDRGEQGIQGIQGERGLTGAKGDKGDKGDTGAQGIQGIQGEKGEQGIQGEKGEKGDKGDKGDTGEVTTEEFLKAFVTDSASGSIASFPDGADDIPLKSLVVDINPIQDLSQGDPSPENICPISGWDEANVTRTGKNLYDTNFSDYTKPYDYYIKPIKLESGKRYVLKAELIGTPVTGTAFGVTKKGDRYSEFTPYLVVLSSGAVANFEFTADGTFTSPKLIAYASGQSKFDEVMSNYNITLKVKADQNNYEPYQGKSITIDLGQTVYGGKLDVLSGKLVVDRAMVDLGTLSWMATLPSSGNNYFSATIIGLKPAKSSSVAVEAICSAYKTVPQSGWFQNMPCLYYNSSENMLAIGDRSYSDAASFKAAVTGQQLVYELAEPIEIQLTPNEVNSLLGQNNIWADTGDTKVEYRADTKLYIEKLTQPEEDDMIADSAISEGRFFMIGNTLYRALANIASGATITVGTNAERVSLSDALNLVNA